MWFRIPIDPLILMLRFPVAFLLSSLMRSRQLKEIGVADERVKESFSYFPCLDPPIPAVIISCTPSPAWR